MNAAIKGGGRSARSGWRRRWCTNPDFLVTVSAFALELL
jgi:hypothetical protein